MTLRELVAAHPEWLDRTLAVVYDGEYEFVGASADVYPDEVVTAKTDNDPTPTLLPVLVFAPN